MKKKHKLAQLHAFQYTHDFTYSKIIWKKPYLFDMQQEHLQNR